MDAEPFEESLFFAAIASSGARVLLIGRRALVALGLPVLTYRGANLELIDGFMRRHPTACRAWTKGQPR